MTGKGRSDRRHSAFSIPHSAFAYQIAIANEQRVLKADRRRLRRVAERTLAVEEVREAEISVALVDNARIHEINRQFLGHDYPTDVISFLLECDSAFLPLAKGGSAREPRGSGKSLSGEIIISAEMAAQTASRYQWNPHDELLLYLVHGLLHLCSYDDLSAAEQRIMRTRETEILALWNLVPHYVERPV